MTAYPTVKPFKILVVDDEEVNLGMLEEYLCDSGYTVFTAKNGEAALEMMYRTSPDIVLLDRMMPGIDGIEVLRRIKADATFQHVPVIMQTAAASTKQVVEGIEAGAYYYLTKPFDSQTLHAIVNSAAYQVEQRLFFEEQVIEDTFALDCVMSSVFRPRTMAQMRKLAVFLARLCPIEKSLRHTFPELSYGFSELLVNALEHGNLGITYDEKSDYLRRGKECWLQEVERRSALPENHGKFVEVTYQHRRNGIEVHIKDQGAGFDWSPYLDIDPARCLDNHGRGIALANVIFDKLQFIGCGNEVACTVTLNQSSWAFNHP